MCAKKASKKPREKRFPCICLSQGKYELAFFSATAKDLFQVMAINQRDPDNDRGYQRVCSPARVKAIGSYVDRKKPLPLSILVSLENDSKLSGEKTSITIPMRKGAGWVIDGQHRLTGAAKADLEIQLPVVAFMGLAEREQAEQFVTINKEQKGVPTSLRYDLLKHMPDPKTETDRARERATEIAHSLRRDEDSPFIDRIPVVRAPKAGEISLTNFVRKVHLLVHPNNRAGVLADYAPGVQEAAINNYYDALMAKFPKLFEKYDSIFFKTLGFGAMMNAFPAIFRITVQSKKGFKTQHIMQIFDYIDDFDFDGWRQMGTGSKAENDAAADLRALLEERIEAEGGTTLDV